MEINIFTLDFSEGFWKFLLYLLLPVYWKDCLHLNLTPIIILYLFCNNT